MFHIFLFLAFICHYFSIIHRSGAFYFRIYEVLVTETGSTKNPEDSGYNYPQTIPVGRITDKWELISTYRVAEKVDPQYLLDPEEQEAA